MTLSDAHATEPLERGVRAHEVVHELVGRVVEQRLGRVVLLEPAVAHERDLVGETDRLVDVVRDEDDGLSQLALDLDELGLQPVAIERVDRAERLVHEQHRRVGGKRAGDADALRLAAGELPRVLRRVLAGSSPTRSSSSAARDVMRSAFQPSSLGTVAMFSATVRCGNRPTDWIA